MVRLLFVASNEFVVAWVLLLLSLAVADSEDVAVDGVVVAGIVAVAAVIFGADQDRERLSNKTLEGRDDGDIVIVVVVVVVHKLSSVLHGVVDVLYIVQQTVHGRSSMLRSAIYRPDRLKVLLVQK